MRNSRSMLLVIALLVRPWRVREVTIPWITRVGVAMVVAGVAAIAYATMAASRSVGIITVGAFLFNMGWFLIGTGVIIWIVRAVRYQRAHPSVSA